MKKIISLFLILIIVLSCNIFSFADYNNLYAIAMVVYKTDIENNIIIFRDFNGNLWQYQTEVEDWLIGDIAEILMDNNDTKIIYDDIILDARYCGYIEN